MINCRCQEAGSYQARAEGPPSVASRHAARPVKAVSADIQGTAWTGTCGDLVVSSSVTHFGTHTFAVAGRKA